MLLVNSFEILREFCASELDFLSAVTKELLDGKTDSESFFDVLV